MLNWGSMFNVQSEKKAVAKNIYESKLYDTWVSGLDVTDDTKMKYLNYRDEFVRFLKDKEVEVPSKDDIKDYIKWKRVASVRTARQKLSLFKRYVDWLVEQGKMSNNVWNDLNYEELKISNRHATAQDVQRKRVKGSDIEEEKDSDETEKVEFKTSFSLTDVAMLLLAIEEKDTETMLGILTGQSGQKS